ncbi:unnamed protein product [Auanema sp. JU1783]|nr:unnamed protein product [Auanema sp. JU1783]
MNETSEDSQFLDQREIIIQKLAAFDDLDRSGKTLLSPVTILEYGSFLIKNELLSPKTEVLYQFCRLLIISLDGTKETNITSAFLSKDTISQTSQLVTHILSLIPDSIYNVDTSRVSEIKKWQLLIHFMLVFGSATTWSYVKNAVQIQIILNSMCQKMSSVLYTEANYNKMAISLFVACNDYRPVISVEALNALFSIIMKPFREEVNQELLPIFIKKILICPAITLHLSQPNLKAFSNGNLFVETLMKLRVEPELFENVEPQRKINLMGNMIHLGYINLSTKLTQETLLDWTWFLGTTMAQCIEFSVRPGTKSSHNHWHPIFGNYKLPIDQKTEGALKNVIKQLRYLWSSRVVTGIFQIAFESSESSKPKNDLNSSNEISTTFSKLFKRIGGGGGSNLETSAIHEEPPTLPAVVCSVYVSTLSCMPHLKGDIISGMCHSDLLLQQLWAYLKRWGSPYAASSSEPVPLTAALKILTRPNSTHAAPLHLFAEAASSVISILDEEEMYDKGIPFPTSELLGIAKFCNWFCFKAIWQGIINKENVDRGVFAAIHGLLLILYARDCRKAFTSDPKFWLSPDIKSTALISEYEKRTQRGLLVMEKLSHCILLRERMLLFRKFISEEKCNIEGPASLITVARNRIVEDGYRQLSMLSDKAMKNVIRVKFVNQQGLEEAGIDQDGVFKEFLEMTIKHVFNPSLNLFMSTSSGVLYPSLTSFVHEDHIDLFQFIGRMLGKAVFEGIVVDVQLAPVLLAAVLGGRRLCAFDELYQLDPELYKNLTFVKRYEGDISDLSLTFSINEDLLGKVVTTDLIPGGRTITVTNENKIDYIHRMAYHRVFGQTRNQCKAFVNGIQSILRTQWLSLFAPHEIQYLISGQTCDIDIADLKKHVQYYGGFHGSHRLIKWLWDIVENEFSAEERRLFLKFVTSCSRPPLLGFSYLEPPFSIRCVEVSDDHDTGDTLGSVVRGFLALRRSQSVTRLPTASTCFNLLKLPNYNKKSVLLSKLRYAIHAESGFELS